MTLYLDKTFADAWGRDPFDHALRQRGEVFREKEGRRTLRFEVGGAGYFLKLHQGVGWLEILKNLAQLRLPVVSARNEWRAIRRLRELHLRAPVAVAYGSRGLNPARRLSFLVTEELTGSVSLEEFCATWRQRPPHPTAKRALIAQVADIARTMHESGVNHRDFYLCHLRIDVSDGDPGGGGELGGGAGGSDGGNSGADDDALAAANARLTILDLHRAQIRRKTPVRWRVKDLGGLYFSARDIGLTSRDVLRFMKTYRRKNTSELANERTFWTKVANKAKRIHHGDFGYEPALPLG
ncbi:MAG: lipopolysaccharide core heptose(I) kinase RfaP [Gammaproteobacteria bacterium]|nr:lipopolysaccharide core heptose(I) kinase RfaP [Gammaproteobacteria bacterium]